MDKYEFNIKVEQMKKLMSKNDFETAAKIADSIDWRRVRSANLLTTVASIYEENGDYQEAIDILMIAFERSPNGKFLIYKLTMLALKNNNIPEAEAYYNEFCELASDDSRKYLLRYLILKQKGAMPDQLIPSLEHYVDIELDEKWLYELAELYHESGRQDQCVQLCDKIILMFGLGKYVDRAMELKLQYEPLTQYQLDLMENKDKYEEKLRAVEIEYGGGNPVKEVLPNVVESFEEEPQLMEEQKEPLPLNNSQLELQEDQLLDDGAEEVLTNEEMPMFADQEVAVEHQKEKTEPDCIEPSEDLILDEPSEESKAVELNTQDTDNEQARQETEMHQIKAVTPMAAEALKHNAKEMRAETVRTNYEHMIIESEDKELGVAFAIQSLKKIHQRKAIKRPVVKITGDKLNKKGILSSAEQLKEKDLVIEYAGDMASATLQELQQWIQTAGSDTNKTVILIDNPRQIGRLKLDYPLLTDLFHCTNMEEQIFEDPIPKETKTHLGVSIKEEFVDKKKETMEMDWEEFEHYACQYASEIDCYIPQKSMLALQERIEIMEEDGVTLSRKNAEDLIENAADKAEKSTIGRVFTGIFAPKYNKEGLLILREKHFLE